MVQHDPEIQVTTRLLQPNASEFRFKLPADDPLLRLMQRGAELAGSSLLPTADAPLDRLHNIRHGDPGPPIEDLSEPIKEFVTRPGTTKDFGIELVLAFRVNTRWAIAPSEQLTPREILALPQINLDPSQYSLYLANSSDLLPLDAPIHITRGMAFEAQRDGRYGS
jgi:hypothetical protein